MSLFQWGLSLVILAFCMGGPGLGFAGDWNVIVLDCTSSGAASDLTSKFPAVYLSNKNFEA
jgi:hypothetical protein